MSGGSKNVVVGYRYYVGIHFAIARAVEKILRIDVGEREAWSGDVASGDIIVDAPNLHGGDEQEGGVKGTFTVQDGNSSQALDSYLSGKIAGSQPNYRGFFGGIWKQGLTSARSPYVKPWAFLVKRTAVKDDLTTQWNAAQADIDGDMNPAHIIRECLTNTVWGLGISELELDEPSFLATAQTLVDESFGLSFLWSDGSVSMQNFLTNVLNHIDGLLFVDPSTGKFTLKLVREDYVVANLDTFDQDDIQSVSRYVKTTPGEVTTQMEVRFINRAFNYEEDGVIIHNLAMSDVQGGNVPDQRRFEGVTKKSLAVTLATRELRAASAMLSKCTIRGNRRMAELKPGDVFKLSWPPLGINQIVFRVLNAQYGTLDNGGVTLDVVEDVFGIEEAIYASSATAWVEPYSDPTDATTKGLLELPLWSVVRLIIPESQIDTLADAAAYVQTLAKRPTQDSLSFDVQIDQGSGYVSEGSGYFVPNGTLASGIDMLATTMTMSSVDDLTAVETGTYALINNEIVEILTINTGLNQITVNRGVLDTLPASHSTNDVIWFPESNQVAVEKEYSDGDSLDFKPLVRTSRGTLALGSATAVSKTMEGRAGLPFAPGNVRAHDGVTERNYNGAGLIAIAVGATDIEFRWAHRDRTTQTASFVTQSTGDIGPEPGTTYTLRIKTLADAVLRTINGLTGTSYNYLSAEQTVDFGSLPNSFKFELEAIRNGSASFQTWDLTVQRSI